MQVENTQGSAADRCGPPLWLLLVIVAAAAVAVRAAVFPQLVGRLPLHRDAPRGTDAFTYHVWAQQIIAFGPLRAKQQPFYYSPLYPYMLSGAYLVAGSVDITAGMVMNAGVGVACAVCVAGLAWRLAGGWAGLVSGLLLALSGAQVATEALLLTDGVLPALCMGALWLAVELRRRERCGRPLPAWLWLGPGLLLGVAAVGRGSNLLVGAAFCAMLAAPALKRRAWRPVVSAAALGAGVALAVAVPVLRNGLMFDTWKLTTNGPVNLFIGNAPGATGIFTYPPGFDELWSRFDKGDSAWLGELGRRIGERPAALPAVLGRKTLLFFNSWHAPDNGDYYFFRRYVPLLRFCTLGPLVIYTLGFAGVALTARRWRRMAPLYVFGLSFAASIIIVLVSGRYKLPFLALLCVFAGAATPDLLLRLGAGSARGLLAPALLAVALGAAFWPRGPVGIDMGRTVLRPQEFRVNSAALLRAGRTEEGMAMLEDGAALFPPEAVFPARLAELHLMAGRPGAALAQLEDAFEAEPTLRGNARLNVRWLQALERVAGDELRAGRIREALQRIEGALGRGAVSQRLLEQRLYAYLKLDQNDRARMAALQLLARYPDSRPGRRALERLVPELP